MVENHVRALLECDDIDRIVLVSDHRDGGLSRETKDRVRQIRLPGFDYDPAQLSAGSAVQRSAACTAQLESELDSAGVHPQRSVLHWHNHSIGKNTAAPAVVRRLAIDGWRLLLQIHDFAEDNRPENYRRLIRAASVTTRNELDEFLFPVAAQIHYATLTNGDAEVLTGLGIPADQLHRLPNSVVLPTRSQPAHEQSLALVRDVMCLDKDARWCLYPVRGIRRKNVGEFLLLCRWLPENHFGGLTLCPTTSVEKRSYERWRRVAKDLSPRAIFDAAHHPEVSFIDNLAASDFAVSTSVAEGFGMAFLEPWLANRGVIARRLPSVTDDFASAGVRLPSLYSQIPVPGDASWLRKCRDQFREAFHEAWSTVPANFRPQYPGESNPQADTIDFACLTPAAQTEVLGNAADSSQYESARTEVVQRVDRTTSPSAR